MMKISELIGRELAWAQPHALMMEYELRAGDAVAGAAGLVPGGDDAPGIGRGRGGSHLMRMGIIRTQSRLSRES